MGTEEDRVGSVPGCRKTPTSWGSYDWDNDRRNQGCSEKARYNPGCVETTGQTTSVSYVIEPKPGGGFIARSADPAIPPIEASTQTELKQEIQAAALSRALCGIKLPPNLEQAALGLTVDNARQQNIVITTNKGRPHPATQEEIDQVASILGKKFPQFTQAMAARVVSAKAASDGDLARLGGSVDTVSNCPIVPERGNAHVFAILMGLLALGSLVFFLLHR